MPYIPQGARPDVHPTTDKDARNAGELNYQITVLINRYININGMRYQAMNDVVGALDGAKVEFQRRVVGPYEDRKIEENGDAYSPANVEDPNAY